MIKKLKEHLKRLIELEKALDKLEPSNELIRMQCSVRWSIRVTEDYIKQVSK